ncbi:MAG TPA: NUDIX domain-containing protein [Candidatus Saccharimonadales bacterium]|nr:NUDIX domain-containing protein [Candidatus Saccharimonadales bacterium]
MSRSFETKIAVFLALIQDDQVLLGRRQNTGWLDGHYDMPSGHLEPSETLLSASLRELEEETGLSAKEEDLEFFHICQNYMTPDKPYMFIMFRVNKWTGEPKIMEPHLSDDQAFFPLEKLPDKTLPYVAKALGELDSKSVSFSYFDEEDLRELGQ